MSYSFMLIREQEPIESICVLVSGYTAKKQSEDKNTEFLKIRKKTSENPRWLDTGLIQYMFLSDGKHWKSIEKVLPFLPFDVCILTNMLDELWRNVIEKCCLLQYINRFQSFSVRLLRKKWKVLENSVFFVKFYCFGFSEFLISKLCHVTLHTGGTLTCISYLYSFPY